MSSTGEDNVREFVARVIGNAEKLQTLVNSFKDLKIQPQIEASALIGPVTDYNERARKKQAKILERNRSQREQILEKKDQREALEKEVSKLEQERLRNQYWLDTLKKKIAAAQIDLKRGGLEALKKADVKRVANALKNQYRNADLAIFQELLTKYVAGEIKFPPTLKGLVDKSIAKTLKNNTRNAVAKKLLNGTFPDFLKSIFQGRSLEEQYRFGVAFNDAMREVNTVFREHLKGHMLVGELEQISRRASVAAIEPAPSFPEPSAPPRPKYLPIPPALPDPSRDFDPRTIDYEFIYPNPFKIHAELIKIEQEASGLEFNFGIEDYLENQREDDEGVYYDDNTRQMRALPRQTLVGNLDAEKERITANFFNALAGMGSSVLSGALSALEGIHEQVKQNAQDSFGSSNIGAGQDCGCAYRESPDEDEDGDIVEAAGYAF